MNELHWRDAGSLIIIVLTFERELSKNPESKLMLYVKEIALRIHQPDLSVT